MCGIAGIYRRDGVAVGPEEVRAMARAVAHRGPDGDGVHVDGPLGFGHQRLAILDLTEAGDQPMSTRDGRFVLVYNGEVYNFRELRSQLERQGVRFRSRSDTEVVLEALAHWGRDALTRFNGMFSLALWDRDERSLLLARDRVGIKPLYYCAREGALLFGSEIKAMLAHPAFGAELDREALVEYLTFQNLFTERTLFRDAHLLPAGSWLKAGPNGRLERGRYWDFSFEEPSDPANRDEYIEELDRLFEQAVKRQLVSDVDVSAYLSGGMDSGSVAAIAAAELGHMRTFTVGFDMRSASGMELAFDERDAAEHLSYHLQTEHYEMVLKAGDMERAMADLVWHLEEPRVGQSYPNFYAAKLAGSFDKVVLSGAGGDEIFAGYPWRYYRAVVNEDFDDYAEKYYRYWQRLIPDAEMPGVLGPIWPGVEQVSTREIFRGVFDRHAADLTGPEDFINHSLYFEAKTFLNGLLVVEDKLAMAHGLETRLPFLDNDLVEFAQRVPVGMKLGNLGEVVRLNENEPGPKTSRFFERTRDGKLILRDVMKRHVPEDVTQREKQGFSGPDASWFRGESIDYVRRRLHGSDARIYDYLDADTVRGMVAEHLDGERNRRLLIWSLLSLEQWCETFLEGSRPAEPAGARG